jgi:hypothetical protein
LQQPAGARIGFTVSPEMTQVTTYVHGKMIPSKIMKEIFCQNKDYFEFFVSFDAVDFGSY